MPNRYFDISDVNDAKHELIRNYKSQLKYIDYIHRIAGLNSYRGMNVHCGYAEVYYEMPIDDYIKFVNL